jgi:uncharacterized protein YbgA (DUF1722 family)/uncharacterized protein YbbK (DUF523 family)
MIIKKIPIGISSCLLGEKVRFDGGHKRDAYIMGTLSEYFEFKAFCPEMALGLGTPRPSMRLVKVDNTIECITQQGKTITNNLRELSIQQQSWQMQLCGYILKKDSPSCGMERVKVMENTMPKRVGVGIYAQELLFNNPLLPVEEEGRLGDSKLRENFIQRVYVLHRWQQLLKDGLSINSLTKFHARHKLIIMSHGDYRDLGQLIASLTKTNLIPTAELYIAELMTILKIVVNRNNHVNVLQHIQGYLKKELTADNKAELCDLIERYRQGQIPLIVPLTLLKHHFRQFPDPYIEDCYYLSPYPQELQLINQL